MNWGITELIVISVILAVLILPIKIAANYVNARRTGAFMCLFALLFAAIIQSGVAFVFPLLEILHPIIDSIAALLLSAFAYMLVLGTSYIKGIIIALLQIILSFLLLFLISMMGLGISETILV